MHLGQLKPSFRKKTKRCGQGNGSGLGKQSGRGNKGQTARTGGRISPYFEGGQMPLYRKTPIRGFNNKQFKNNFQIVNICDFSEIEAGQEVTPEVLYAAGLIADINEPVKVLADGEIKVALKIHAHKFSKNALEKIKAAGGEAIIL